MQESNKLAVTTDIVKLQNMAAEMTGSDQFDFTVNMPSKAEQLESQKANVQESPWLLSVFKILVTGFISIALLLSLIATKLTIVTIGQQFHVSCTEPDATCSEPINVTNLEARCTPKRGTETPYVVMSMIVMIPQLISFVEAAYNSAFSNQPWPSCQAIYWVSFCFHILSIDLFYLPRDNSISICQ